MRAVFPIIALLAAFGPLRAEPVALLDGKLKIDIGSGFEVDKPNKPSSPQTIIDFKSRNSDAWGAVLRGTHGLQMDGLSGYMDRKVADYTKGLSWLPKLTWLKKEIVAVNGRKWVDLRYIAPRENAKNERDGLMYTRFFSTSYGGQLLEITFTSNTDPSPGIKDKIDKVIESVQLAD